MPAPSASSSLRFPRYCLHKATGQAYVRLDGRMHYLGVFASPESKSRYRELTDAWRLRQDSSQPVELSVGELILLYVEHAKQYYRKSGRPTSEVGCIEAACRFLMPHRRRRAADFGPLLLEAARAEMVKDDLARTTINSQCGRIRRMFRWAVSKEFVRPQVLTALETMAPLKAGRCDARETSPVEPVADTDVDVVLSELSEPLQAVVNLLRLTGARTGEILSMRTGEIDRSVQPWEYRPAAHKTQHKGKKRVILLGPQSQEIILPLLRADAKAFVFRPRDEASERYSSHAVGKAVARAIRRLNVERANPEVPPIPHWHPHQLRHSAATRLRKEAGFEIAKTVLGHTTTDMTELYAERDLDAARRAVAICG